MTATEPAWDAVGATVDRLHYESEREHAAWLHRTGVGLALLHEGLPVLVLEPRDADIPDVLLWTGSCGGLSISVAFTGCDSLLPWRVSLSHYRGSESLGRWQGTGQTLSEAVERATEHRDREGGGL